MASQTIYKHTQLGFQQQAKCDNMIINSDSRTCDKVIIYAGGDVNRVTVWH
jgi:hypothetical protein